MIPPLQIPNCSPGPRYPDTPEGLVEELRDAARERCRDLEIDPDLHQADMMEWDAADCIEDAAKRLDKLSPGWRKEVRRTFV